MNLQFPVIQFLPILLCSICLISCNDEPADDSTIKASTATAIALSAEQKTLCENNASFADDLFNVTSQMKKDENFIISPLGASITLSMIANAANGNTKAEILNALYIREGDLACFNSLNKTLAGSLSSISTCKLSLNNSLWYNSDLISDIDPVITSTLADYYGASIYGVPSRDYMSRANSWIADKTNNGIKKFLTDQEVDNFVVSVFNLLDFYGGWNQSGKVPTVPMDFHNISGSTTNLTSRIFDNLLAWSTGYAYVFEIKYNGSRSGAGYAFRVILPYEDVSVDEALSTYREFLADPQNLYYFMFNGGEYINLKVYLPKFAVSSMVDLSPMLQALGIVDLFNPDVCDLAVGTDAKVFINQLKQFSQIEVDETGTKYQAITTGEGAMTVQNRPIPEITKIDRPFAFEIVEKSTGTSILQGRINNL